MVKRMVLIVALAILMLGAMCRQARDNPDSVAATERDANNYEGNLGAVAGRIIDSQTSEPLVGVSVWLKGTTIGALTDIHGRFKIVRIEPGPHTLVLTYVGYKKAETSVDIQGNSSTEIGLSLMPQAIDTQAQTLICVLRPTELHGAITDRTTGLPIKKAKLELTPGGYSTKTNSKGEYRLEIRGGAGDYRVSISHKDYEPLDVSGIKLVSDGTTVIDTSLQHK